MVVCKRRIAGWLAALIAGTAIAAERSPLEVLRAQFPQGIPWKVEISDTNGKSLGDLEVLIKTEHAHSCLGEIDDGGVRVEFIGKHGISDSLIESYGIAKISGNRIQIDLTGGTCDAYVIMDGMVAPDGSSIGDVFTLSLNGGHDIGKYRATLR
jgi:hypothetical protein